MLAGAATPQGRTLQPTALAQLAAMVAGGVRRLAAEHTRDQPRSTASNSINQ